jgi:hypothetical protein
MPGPQARCFPVRPEIVFGRKTPANHTFQDGESLILLQIGLFRSVDETHVYLQRRGLFP